MALDTVEIDNLQAGDDIGTDLIGGVHYQVAKIAWGTAGTVTLADASNPVPVTTAAPSTGAAELAKAEDAASASGDVGIAMYGIRDDVLSAGAGVSADGDYLPFRTNSTGAMWVAGDGNFAITAASLPLPTGASTESTLSTLNGKVTACNTGAVVISSGTVTANAGTGTQAVSLASVPSHAVTNAGTFATQIDGAALTALQLLDNPIVAHDAAASGSTGVNMAGARAVASVRTQTETTAADATRINATLSGNIITQAQVAPEELLHNKAQAGVTATTSTAVTNFTAGGAGIHNYITSVTVHNTNASTNTFVKLQDGSGGGTEWVLPAPATGGTTHNFDPPLKQTTANTALHFATDAAVSTVYVFVNGYQGQG